MEKKGGGAFKSSMLDDGSKEDRRDQRKKKQAGESGVHSCVARISISLVFLMQCMLLDVGAPYQKIQYKLCNCSSVFLQVLGLRKISVIKKEYEDTHSYP